MPAFINLANKRFGNLIAIKRSGTANDGQALWMCVCDCGQEAEVKAGNLRSGHTKSCGCFMKRRITETLGTHMQSHQRLYNVWSSIKARCYNQNSLFFTHYGGRGISICDEWRDDYQAFHDWAMKNGYNPDAPKWQCTIDRINVNGNYSPDNCRWVDMKTQRHNRRDSRKDVSFN